MMNGSYPAPFTRPKAHTPYSQSIAGLRLRLYVQGGPCFTIFKHILGDQTSPPEGECTSPLTTYIGWPAHYSCPDGYMWIAPSNIPATDAPTGIPDTIACISCLPGICGLSYP